jgi:hypothetical protein
MRTMIIAFHARTPQQSPLDYAALLAFVIEMGNPATFVTFK